MDRLESGPERRDRNAEHDSRPRSSCNKRVGQTTPRPDEEGIPVAVRPASWIVEGVAYESEENGAQCRPHVRRDDDQTRPAAFELPGGGERQVRKYERERLSNRRSGSDWRRAGQPANRDRREPADTSGKGDRGDRAGADHKRGSEEGEGGDERRR